MAFIRQKILLNYSDSKKQKMKNQFQLKLNLRSVLL